MPKPCVNPQSTARNRILAVCRGKRPRVLDARLPPAANDLIYLKQIYGIKALGPWPHQASFEPPVGLRSCPEPVSKRARAQIRAGRNLPPASRRRKATKRVSIIRSQFPGQKPAQQRCSSKNEAGSSTQKSMEVRRERAALI